MKICDITHFYSPKSGGVKTYLLNKVDYINRNGSNDIEHLLILPSDTDKIENNGKSSFHFIKSPKIPFCDSYRGIISKKKIEDIIISVNPDIVEVGSPYMIPSWMKSIRKDKNFKIVAFYHADIEKTWLSIVKTDIERETIRKLARNYVKKTYNDMNLIIAPSEYVKKYLNDLGITNVSVVYLGLDSRIFSEDKIDLCFRERYNVGKKKIILLFVGRFSSEKRISKLLKLFNILDECYPEKYHLILVGGGPEEDKLLNITMKNITVVPYCTDKEKLARIYNSSDIFITASNSETFGLSLLEAQSCGLPVVAFNSGPIPEIVYKKEFLADSDSQFIQNIENVSKILSKKLRSEIRNFTIKNFSWDKTFSNLFKIYREL